MVSQFEVKKNLFILFWALFSSFVIWSINFVINSEFSPGSLLWFTIMLLITGFSFFFLTEMIRTPISIENNEEWNNFGKKLFPCGLIILTIVGIGYLEKELYPMGGLITILAIFIGIFFVTNATDKAYKAFKTIEAR